ncbi:hypothetical protein [Legionella sp.]|uniref:hypothetical protein n=1 Tax=Legionella sp. TaxID=459 RepID=UPI003CC2CDBC
MILQARFINKHSEEAPGTLLEITADYWQVTSKSQIIQLEQIIPIHTSVIAHLEEIAAHYDLTIGSCLSSEEEVTLLEYEYINKMYAIHELFWLQQLSHFDPAQFLFQTLALGKNHNIL